MSATQRDADLIGFTVLELTVRDLLAVHGLNPAGLHLLRRRFLGDEWSALPDGIDARRILLAADVTTALELSCGVPAGRLPVLPPAPEDIPADLAGA